jgi:hypothetical protein
MVMIRSSVALLLSMFLVTTSVAADERVVGMAATNDDTAARPAADVQQRPRLLLPMYVSLAALQGYDVHSTLAALNRGAVEANPMLAGIVRSPGTLLIVKGASTCASIYAAERLWRGHRRGAAVAVLAATNAILLGVAVHNASVLGTQR